MNHYCFFYTARPYNYADQAQAHADRVAAAGGQGADLAFLTRYYTLVGQNLLLPRAYFNLRCGYRLDQANQVEYMFDPNGTAADLYQPDITRRCFVGSDGDGYPVLQFTGNQFYKAVTTSYYELGTDDLLTYVRSAWSSTQTASLYEKGSGSGSYYFTHLMGPAVAVLGLVDGQKGYEEYIFNPSLPDRSAGNFVWFGQFVLRYAQRSRLTQPYAYSNELSPVPPSAGNSLSNGADYTMGMGLVGAIAQLLHLKASPGQVANDHVWDFLTSTQ